MSFLPDGVIKYEDSYVHPDYRGKGIYKKLYEARDAYVTRLFKGSKIISYCKPITVEFFKKQGFIEKGKGKLFFRKGKTGSWKDELSVNLIKKVEKAFYKEMIELGYL